MTRTRRTKETLTTKWHRLDGDCLALGEACPPQARQAIATAATHLGHAEEYPARDEPYFLRLATQCLSTADRLMRPVLEQLTAPTAEEDR